ncbi:uncharacterized protein LOC115224017 [Octopus sinensis]|uniref:Uncharacterized protein LOC115224017 n=1 Tax=Octopus sinensis TaxID=2607531 RepID=A0A6P7TH25_9MOLL|nr:uncharacterized protein LOC115224017 [Octopus sinensis]XP_036368785.1 uncharacterized protein LOC115224017 [Octopus sinensis]XP_036368787.1 uncharacterized protein LOC115224017 [Octopus sinensis]
METILQISLSWLILACILQSLLLYIPTVAGYSNDTILLKYVPASKTFIQSHGLMHIPIKRTRTNLEISPLGSNRKIGRLKKQEFKISHMSAAELKCRYRNILYKLFSTKNLPIRSIKYNCHDTVSNTQQPIDGYSPQLHLGRFKRSADSLRTQAKKKAKRKSAEEQNVSSNNTLSTNNNLPNPTPKITKPTKTAASSSHNPRRKTKKQTETAASSSRNRRRKTTRPTIAAASYVRKPRSKIIQPTAAASLIYNPRSKVINPTAATSSRSKNIKPTAAASFVHNPPDKITPTPTTSFIKTTMITDVDTKSIPYKTQQPTAFSSLPKIVSSSIPLPQSSITASKSEAILLSSSHKTASTSLFVQSTSSAPQSKPSMAMVTPIYNSLPLNTVTTSTNIHPVTSSKFEPSGLTSHLLHSGSEGPLMTKMPTPFITLQLKNDSTDTNTQPKTENSLHLTPTYAPTNRRSKKNVSLLSNQLRTASLSTSNIVLLLNNSLLATLDTKQSSLPVQTTTVHNPNLSSKTLKLDSTTKTLSSNNNSRLLTKPVNEETTVISKSSLPPTNSLFKSFTLHPNTVSSSQLFTLLQPTPNTGFNSTSFSQTFPSSKYKFFVSTNGASVESKATASPTAGWTKNTLETKSNTFTTTIATIFKPLQTSTSDPSTTNFSVKERKGTQNSYLIVPDWKAAKQEWKAAWHVHIYTFGSLFALLAIYLLICLLRLRHTIHLLSNYYFVAVNLLLFTFCLLRALFLLVDGYNSDHTYHYLIGFLLFYLAFPCLTSAFALIFYAFLKTAKVYYLSSKFQCLPLLITIIVVHFILPITAAILIGLSLSVNIFLFVCQIFFVLWGLSLFLGYIYVYKRLHFAAEKRQKLLLQLREAKIHMDNYTIYKERLTLCLGVTVALFSSIIGTFCTCLQVYSALYFLGIFPNELPRAWPWWGYQTAVRFFEFLFCIITTYISTLPFKHRSKYGCDPWFYCSSYTWLCRKENMWNSHKDISWTNMDENISSIGISKDTRRKEIKAAGYEIIPLTISLSQESENLALDEPDSMLIVQNGFVRFRTDEELEELRQSPRVPRMHAVAPIPVSIPKVPKTLQWSNSNSSKCHQNNGFQSKDALLGSGSSPECLSSSTSPSSSQFNRVSTAGSELTFKAPSLSLASSIDKELEHFFHHSSHRSLSSVTSADVLAINEDTSSENSVFQADDNADGMETGDDLSKQIPSFFLTEEPDDSLNTTDCSRNDNLNLTSYPFHNSNPQITNV